MINKFYYKNFEPSIDQRISAENCLERIEDAAPYASTVIGVIERMNESYSINLDVHSKFGLFSANSHNANLEEALRSLEEKIMAKLDGWKIGRFEEFKNVVSASLGKGKDWVAVA